MKEFEVYRVEDRWSPDGVDFWDFLSEKRAKYFITTAPAKGEYTIRKLSQEELVETAISYYMSTLGFFRGEAD